MNQILTTITAALAPASNRNNIIFENPGEIDLTAISTFGVSVKEGENPIGFFGTGLKYAIAILLRNKHTVTIWSGLERVTFDTEVVAIRGQDFDIVRMNGERLGFTTQVGKTWEMWMAYRELFCNARDEGGTATAADIAPTPAVGRTMIVVTGQEIMQVHGDRWKYFMEDAPDFSVDGMDIWKRSSVSYFYRGVCVQQMPRQAMLTYNDKTKLDLTEDRTVKDGYQVGYRIARAILRFKNETLLRAVLTADKQWLEHHLDFHGWGVTPSEEFLRVVGDLVNGGLTGVNATARRVWEEAVPASFNPYEIGMTSVQQRTLEKALDFCGKIGFPVRGAYPILVVDSLGKDTIGLAKDGKIYISERAFQMGGAKQVAATLIEEFAHLRFDYDDCSRPMQNFLFEKMVSLGEELVGEPL